MGQSFYYPIPAGAAVVCKNCGVLLKNHLDERGGWRGCPVDNAKEFSFEDASAHPVWLVSTGRRRGVDHRLVPDRRMNGNGMGTDASEVLVLEAVTQPLPQAQTEPAAYVAGPRAAVYLAKPNTKVTGLGGQALHVMEALQKAGAAGRTAKELRDSLKITPKSLESVLYRLRLRNLIQAVRAEDAR